jgi:hypothetical protein
LISFPPATEMFHFTGLASARLWIQRGMGGRTAAGFPIRTSSGQRSLSTSPKLFAAGRVLHRLCAPRHPPSALPSLTTREASRPGPGASPPPCSGRVLWPFLSHRLRPLGPLGPGAWPHRREPRSAQRGDTGDGAVSTRLSLHFSRLIENLELDGIEPTTSGLQSPRSPS